MNYNNYGHKQKYIYTTNKIVNFEMNVEKQEFCNLNNFEI